MIAWPRACPVAFPDLLGSLCRMAGRSQSAIVAQPADDPRGSRPTDHSRRCACVVDALDGVQGYMVIQSMQDG
jgi:hypothetical protein